MKKKMKMQKTAEEENLPKYTFFQVLFKGRVENRKGKSKKITLISDAIKSHSAVLSK